MAVPPCRHRSLPAPYQGFAGELWRLQELLGHAFEAAGQPDSARVHYAHVLAAWQNADPEFDARRNTLRLRLQAPGRAPE